jgi:hypothetical protein
MHVDVSVRLTNCYVAFSAELTYGEVVVWFGGFMCLEFFAHMIFSRCGWQMDRQKFSFPY